MSVDARFSSDTPRPLIIGEENLISKEMNVTVSSPTLLNAVSIAIDSLRT